LYIDCEFENFTKIEKKNFKYSLRNFVN